MKTDLYTKAVLTVIAVCLTVMVLKDADIVPTARAAGNSNTHYGLVPLNADGTINVNIKSGSETMKVEIVDINTSDKLNVNIAEVNTYSKLNVSVADINSSSKLNVSVKEVDSWAFTNCIVPVKIKQ